MRTGGGVTSHDITWAEWSWTDGSNTQCLSYTLEFYAHFMHDTRGGSCKFYSNKWCVISIIQRTLRLFIFHKHLVIFHKHLVVIVGAAETWTASAIPYPRAEGISVFDLPVSSGVYPLRWASNLCVGGGLIHADEHFTCYFDSRDSPSHLRIFFVWALDYTIFYLWSLSFYCLFAVHYLYVYIDAWAYVKLPLVFSLQIICCYQVFMLRWLSFLYIMKLAQFKSSFVDLCYFLEQGVSLRHTFVLGDKVGPKLAGKASFTVGMISG